MTARKSAALSIGDGGLRKWRKEFGGVAIIDHKAGQCRWPCAGLLDVATEFCGQAVMGYGPYCKKHTAIAWRGPRPIIANPDRGSWIETAGNAAASSGRPAPMPDQR